MAEPEAPKLTLYEAGTSRSARCRWALAEAGLEAECVTTRPGSDEAKAVHPLGKLPVLAVGDGEGRTLIFESAAIVTFICDLAASKGNRHIIGTAGTVARAAHDQWCSFAVCELDAHLWHTFLQRFQPEDKKFDCSEQDKQFWRRGGAVLELHLADKPFMGGSDFSATDCVVGWSVNWARRSGLLAANDDGAEPFPNISAYCARLLARPLCPLAKD